MPQVLLDLPEETYQRLEERAQATHQSIQELLTRQIIRGFALLRVEALSDGQTVADVLNKLPEIRREVFEELYGKEQVEAWEEEWEDGG